eukprot:Gb_30132 [translate_table: standard]
MHHLASVWGDFGPCAKPVALVPMENQPGDGIPTILEACMAWRQAPSLPLHSCTFPSRGPEAIAGYPFPERSEGKAPSEKFISFRINRVWDKPILKVPSTSRIRLGIPYLTFMISTFNSAPETRLKHARRAPCAPFTTCSSPPRGVCHHCDLLTLEFIATPRIMGCLPNHRLCPALPSLHAPWLGLGTIPIVAQRRGSTSFLTPGGDRTRYYGTGFFIILAKVPTARVDSTP